MITNIDVINEEQKIEILLFFNWFILANSTIQSTNLQIRK